jgi:hypothetical protein
VNEKHSLERPLPDAKKKPKNLGTVISITKVVLIGMGMMSGAIFTHHAQVQEILHLEEQITEIH